MNPDAILDRACEWSVSNPRRLAVIIALLIAAPHFAEPFLP